MKTILGSEMVDPRPTFNFEASSILVIAGCAPVPTESAFWRRLKEKEVDE